MVGEGDIDGRWSSGLHGGHTALLVPTHADPPLPDPPPCAVLPYSARACRPSPALVRCYCLLCGPHERKVAFMEVTLEARSGRTV